MFSLKKNTTLVGTVFSAPQSLTLDYVNELAKRADKGDEASAVTLYQISKKDSPAYVAPVAASTSFGSGTNGVVTVTADYAWLAGNDLTIQVAIAAGANAALAATLTGNDILVTLGTTASAGVADDAKNTAILVAAAINAISGKIFTASKSGTGATAITSAVAKTNFTGGVDEVRTQEKKAWDIAVAKVATLFE